MKTSHVCLTVGLALLGGSAIAKPAQSFKKWYAMMTPRMIRAMEKGDIAFFEKVSTDDFTYTMGGQSQPKKEALQGMQMMMSTAKSVRYQYKPTKFDVKGDHAEVYGVQGYTMVMKGKKRNVMKYSSKTHESWVNMGGMWKVKAIVEKDSKAWMNGKSVDPMKMGQ